MAKPLQNKRYRAYASWFNWPNAREGMTDEEMEAIPNEAQPPFWVFVKESDNVHELTASCEATAALATGSQKFTYNGSEHTYQSKKDWHPNKVMSSGAGKWAFACNGMSGSYPITSSNQSDTGSVPPESSSGAWIIRDHHEKDAPVVYTTMAKDFEHYEAIGKVPADTTFEGKVQRKFKNPAKTGPTPLKSGLASPPGGLD
tara:strand:+ start:301 stop:903 length:603 start_codon:yes stop_codon:yes gene_type:complete